LEKNPDRTKVQSARGMGKGSEEREGNGGLRADPGSTISGGYEVVWAFVSGIMAYQKKTEKGQKKNPGGEPEKQPSTPTS